MRWNDLMSIRPHRKYGFKCGMCVSNFNGDKYIFLGYVDNNKCLIADLRGNKQTVYLHEIKK